jgi:hypothetical protein
LPYYREFLKNDQTVKDSEVRLPRQVSYADYASNRIREIAGTRKK